MDLRFNRSTLRLVRRSVCACATSAGMTAARAGDVTLAVHELAANAVCHGGGSGRLRLQVIDHELVCQVTDTGAPGHRGQRGAGAAGGSSGGRQPSRFPWPLRPGHGLWLVRKLTDYVSAATGPAGSQVTVMFRLTPRNTLPA